MTEAAQPMEDHVLVEVTVPAPADAVWAALRDPAKIKDWFGWETDGLRTRSISSSSPTPAPTRKIGW